jgi:helicase MOV-10
VSILFICYFYVRILTSVIYHYLYIDPGPDDIAVITPYHAQRMKILNLLFRDPKLKDIKVGSVEEFQGQERKVVIISTVRSSTEFIHADIVRTLGFVASPHRFNGELALSPSLCLL